jgi:drug/metabolite transporter (DMT)-like permease
VKAFVALLLLALTWGSAFLFTSVAVRDFDPLHIVILRQGLGALIVGALAYARGLRLPWGWRPWLIFTAMGIMNAGFGQILLGWSLRYIDTGLAAILYAVTPLLSALLSAFLLREERLGPLNALGLLLGFAGVAFAVGTDVSLLDPTRLIGAAFMLGAALMVATSGVFARRVALLRDIDPLIGATGQLGATSIALLPGLFVVGVPAQPPSLLAVGAVLGLAVFSTAIGFALYYWLLAVVGPTRTIAVTYLMPIVALAWGILLLGEQISFGAVVGLGLVLLGITLASRKKPVVQAQQSLPDSERSVVA